MADTLDFSDFASRIIHPLVRALDTSPELRPVAMDTLCALVSQLGKKKYSIFEPLIHKVMTKHKIQSARYEVIWSKVQGDKIGEDGDDDLDLYKHRFSRNRNKDSGLSQTDSTTIKRVSRI